MKQRHFFRPAILLSLLSVFIVHPNAGFAQSSGAGLPFLPTPIQNLVDEGAQIRYLGNDHGLDAWITIKNGQEQYFYVQPDGKSFVMGLLFDDGGELITVDQVTRLRGEGDSVLDALRLRRHLNGCSMTLKIQTGFRWASLTLRLFTALLTRNARIVMPLLTMRVAPALLKMVRCSCALCPLGSRKKPAHRRHF
jgi:hypothetical protein